MIQLFSVKDENKPFFFLLHLPNEQRYKIRNAIEYDKLIYLAIEVVNKVNKQLNSKRIGTNIQ